jgi:phenylalanyl-tRNA synthetase beta chain
MPTITVDKKDLLNLIGKKLTDEKLKDRISMLGTDLDEVTDKNLTVEIFPNRPDMLSTEGFARALSSFVNVNTGLKKYKVNKSSYIINVENTVKEIRPYAACAVVKNIKLNDVAMESLMQVQEKLHTTHGRNRKKASIGIYDLDRIKFPLTYTTKPKNFEFYALGTSKKQSLSWILEKHQKGMKFKHLLEKFEEYPIWIDSEKQVLSMPPIINSEETKVTDNTKNLFIDVTGTDEQAVEQALNIIVTSLSDRGGKIYSVKVGNKIYPNLKPKKIKISPFYLNKRLGLKLTERDIYNLLLKMGIEYKKPYAYFSSYRTDILHEIDIVEDVSIAYGYENFKPEIPNVATIAEEDGFEKFKNKIANLLTGYNLIETNTYNITNKNNQTDKMRVELNLVRISNALNEDYNVLRTWMIPSLLEVLKNNKHNEYPQRIFEIGAVFTPQEKARVGILLSHKNANYTEARQILESLFSLLDLKYEIKETKHDSFIDGRVARVYVKGKGVAYIGELHPEVLENFDLETPVSCFELNLSELYKTINS